LAACGLDANVVTSLRGEVEIVVIVGLVPWDAIPDRKDAAGSNLGKAA
jgi:hypothetical protein